MKEQYGSCYECGCPMMIDDYGVVNHLLEGTDQIDYKQDADHLAVLNDWDTLDISKLT